MNRENVRSISGGGSAGLSSTAVGVNRSQPKGGNGSGSKPSNGGGGGFRAGIHRFLYSGDKKHVFIGLIAIGAISSVPWYFMTRGSKQQSHEDYMEKAERARRERLSSSGQSRAPPPN